MAAAARRAARRGVRGVVADRRPGRVLGDRPPDRPAAWSSTSAPRSAHALARRGSLGGRGAWPWWWCSSWATGSPWSTASTAAGAGPAAPFALVGGSVLFLTIAGMGRAGIFGLEAARISRYVHLLFAMLRPGDRGRRRRARPAVAGRRCRSWPCCSCSASPATSPRSTATPSRSACCKGDPAFVETLPLLDVATEVPRSTVARPGRATRHDDRLARDGNRSGRIPDPGPHHTRRSPASAAPASSSSRSGRRGKPTGCTQLTRQPRARAHEGPVASGCSAATCGSRCRTRRPDRRHHVPRPAQSSAIVARADLDRRRAAVPDQAVSSAGAMTGRALLLRPRPEDGRHRAAAPDEGSTSGPRPSTPTTATGSCPDAVLVHELLGERFAGPRRPDQGDHRPLPAGRRRAPRPPLHHAHGAPRTGRADPVLPAPPPDVARRGPRHAARGDLRRPVPVPRPDPQPHGQDVRPHAGDDDRRRPDPRRVRAAPPGAGQGAAGDRRRRRHPGALRGVLRRARAPVRWDLGPPLFANRTQPVEVSDAFRARIAEDNAYDVELYEFARDELAI